MDHWSVSGGAANTSWSMRFLKDMLDSGLGASWSGSARLLMFLSKKANSGSLSTEAVTLG